ncbi:hypothetical protein ACKFKG_32885 [Phormidesmis sp. 146-35]
MPGRVSRLAGSGQPLFTLPGIVLSKPGGGWRSATSDLLFLRDRLTADSK